MLLPSRRVAVSLLLVAPLLAGCPGEQTAKEPEALPFAGQKVRIGVPSGLGFATTWEGPLREWSAQTGATASLSELPHAELAVTVPALAGDSPPTLAIFALEDSGPLIASRQIAPLPVASRGESGVKWPELFAGLREKLASKKDTAVLVPLSCPVLVCYYRDDLLRAAGLSPPQTWNEYQQLVAKLGDWAPGLVAVEPWSEQFRVTMFFARAAAFAQHPGHFSLFFDIETGAPLIDGAGFVRALETARAAVARMPAEVLTYGPPDCRRELLAGRAALAIAFEAPPTVDAGARQSSPGRPNVAAIGFTRLPGSREVYNASRRAWEPVADKGVNQVTLAGFSGLAAAASSSASAMQIEAAWNALSTIAGSDMVQGFPPGVLGLCRESQLDDPAPAVGPELSATEAAAYADAIGQSLRDTRLVAELPVSGRAELKRSLSAALQGALDGSRLAADALQEAASAWREIVEKLGVDKVRDEYRANLGLSPIARR